MGMNVAGFAKRIRRREPASFMRCQEEGNSQSAANQEEEGAPTDESPKYPRQHAYGTYPFAKARW
jgi:hypothetical protein